MPVRGAWRGAVAVLVAAVAWIVPSGSVAAGVPMVVGTGTYDCAATSGTLTFTPPLTATGTAPTRVVVVLGGTGCSGGQPTPVSVRGTAMSTWPANSCAQLTVPHHLRLAVHYHPLAGGSTLTGSSGFTPGSASYLFSAQGVVTGAYPSAAATISGVTAASIPAVQADCASAAGLHQLTLVDDKSSCPSGLHAAGGRPPGSRPGPDPWCHN